MVAAALLSGCAANQEQPGSETASGSFPVQVASCDENLEFEAAPERVLVLSEADFSILYQLGLADRVIAKAGERRIDEQYPDMNAALDEIPDLGGSNDGSGHTQISTEAVLSVEPDVVFGEESEVDREQLAAAGVQLYSPDVFCPGYTNDGATFELVDEEIDKVATMFGVTELAAELKDEVTANISQVEAAAPDTESTAAALFVTPGSSEFYSYGYSSMVEPIMAANGLSNVYGDVPDRVFETSMESLLDEDPEWLILLASSATPEEAEDVLMAMGGVEGLQAVQNDQILFLPFVMTDPPTTLSVDGAVRLGELMREQSDG